MHYSAKKKRIPPLVVSFFALYRLFSFLYGSVRSVGPGITLTTHALHSLHLSSIYRGAYLFFYRRKKGRRVQLQRKDGNTVQGVRGQRGEVVCAFFGSERDSHAEFKFSFLVLIIEDSTWTGQQPLNDIHNTA